jgi:hypothetical protein
VEVGRQLLLLLWVVYVYRLAGEYVGVVGLGSMLAGGVPLPGMAIGKDLGNMLAGGVPLLCMAIGKGFRCIGAVIVCWC